MPQIEDKSKKTTLAGDAVDMFKDVGSFVKDFAGELADAASMDDFGPKKPTAGPALVGEAGPMGVAAGEATVPVASKPLGQSVVSGAQVGSQYDAMSKLFEWKKRRELADEDDITQAMLSDREEHEAQAAIEELSRLAGVDMPAPRDNARLPSGGDAGKMITLPDGRVIPESEAREITVGDLVRGGIESTTQIIGGARDAIQGTLDLGKDVRSWMESKGLAQGGGVVYDPENGIQFLGEKEFLEYSKNPEFNKLPDVKKPESGTGELIRGVSKFLTGFVGAGKVMSGLKVSGAVATVTKGAAQGFLADFATVGKLDESLTDVVAKFPQLNPIVVDFFRSDPNDSGLEKRTKIALEGLGLGILTEGFMKSLKLIGSYRNAKALKASSMGLPELEKIGPDFSLLGIPDGKLIESRKAAETLTPEAALKTGAKQAAKGSGEPEIFINFARMETQDDVKNTIRQLVNENAKDINQARRGTRTWQATKLSASQEDAWSILQNRRVGQPLNAEESLAARQLWVSSSEKLTELAKKAAQSGSENDLFLFKKMAATHYAIQKEIIAARTETARALQAWAIPAGAGKQQAQHISAILENTGGSKVARSMAEKIAMLDAKGMTASIETFVEGTALAKTQDAVAQVWINSLLSNPATHVANATSNFLSLFQQLGERKAAAYISQALGTEKGVALQEATHMAYAMMSSLGDAFSAASHALKTEESKFGGMLNKVETRVGSLSQEALGIKNETWGKVMNTLDHTTRIPGRLLGASDEFFKTMAYRGELRGQAARLASDEVARGVITKDMFSARVADLVANPPKEIHLEAVGSALYTTFSQKPAEALARIGSLQKVPIVGRLMMPFKNTPMNIMTYVGERTPAAPLIKQWRQDVMAGGAKADIAMARTATGSMMLALATDLAMSGMVTGKAPKEPGARQEWERTHKGEYSVKVGDKWVAYNRLDPLGMLMGLGADLADIYINASDDIPQKDMEDVFINAMFAISNQVMSKTYMRGMSDLMQAITNPREKSETYMGRLAGTLVPSGVAQLARHGVPGVVEGDEYMRQVESMVDNIRRRIPTLDGIVDGSSSLAPYRDLWGRKISYKSPVGWGWDMVSPIYVKQEEKEPIDAELEQLEYFPPLPDKEIPFTAPVEWEGGSRDTVPIKLSTRQYSRFMELAGNELKLEKFGNKGCKDFLNDLVTGKDGSYSDTYQQMGGGKGGGKSEFIKSVLGEYRKAAAQQLISEDKSLWAHFQEGLAKKPRKWAPEFYR